MARKYAIATTDTNTANTTALSLAATTAVRPMIYDVLVGSVATPADNAGEYILGRFTTDDGTGSAYTPSPIDSGDPACTAVVLVNHSGEPTYTANVFLLRFATNQRATFRWVAAPGSELKCPATANSGIGLLQNAIGGSAVAMTYTVLFEE